MDNLFTYCDGCHQAIHSKNKTAPGAGDGKRHYTDIELITISRTTHDSDTRFWHFRYWKLLIKREIEMLDMDLQTRKRFIEIDNYLRWGTEKTPGGRLLTITVGLILGIGPILIFAGHPMVGMGFFALIAVPIGNWVDGWRREKEINQDALDVVATIRKNAYSVPENEDR